jgi:hypothetical protein
VTTTLIYGGAELITAAKSLIVNAWVGNETIQKNEKKRLSAHLLNSLKKVFNCFMTHSGLAKDIVGL